MPNSPKTWWARSLDDINKPKINKFIQPADIGSLQGFPKSMIHWHMENQKMDPAGRMGFLYESMHVYVIGALIGNDISEIYSSIGISLRVAYCSTKFLKS